LAFEIEEADDASITHSGTSEEKTFVRGTAIVASINSKTTYTRKNIPKRKSYKFFVFSDTY